MSKGSFLIVILCLLGAHALQAFRALDPARAAETALHRAESQFRVHEHAELYRYHRILAGGEVSSGRMLLLNRYGEDAVLGVFRLLPSEGFPGATLLNHQPVGKLPRLFLDDPQRGISGGVPPQRWHQKLGNTDWFFEGIFDDDKLDWDMRTLYRSAVNGHRVQVIRARYESAEMRRFLEHDYRLLYVDVTTGVTRMVEFYNRYDQRVYALEILALEPVNIGGEEQLRASRLLLRDDVAGSMTILTRLAALWNTPLPDACFSPENLSRWGSEYDAALLNQLQP